ncbi:MAG TPA: tetratricopeptide repeat protein [Edaphobacter sp.]|nr:tetratricopeptide repeat protein [Edaphobacter sp.]
MPLRNAHSVLVRPITGRKIWLPGLLVGGLLLWPLPSSAQQPAKRSHTVSTSGLLDKAKARLAADDPQGALSILQQAKPGSSFDSDIHAMKGVCLAMLAKPIESAREFDQAIALRPNYAPIYFSAGLAFATFNNLDRALDRFATALRLDPTLPGVRFNYALVLARTGRYAESEKQVDLELAANGSKAGNALDLWRLKARDAYYQKKWLETLTAYGKVLELAPGSAEAYSAMGEALYSLNRSQESMAALEKAVALDPEDGAAHALIGKLYQSENRQDEAIAEFELAHRLVPRDREVVYRLYRLYNKIGNTQDATRIKKDLDALMTASSGQADNERKAVALNNEGIELESKGDVLGALDHYDQAAKADVTNPVFQRNAALLLCRIGRPQEAIRRLDDILAIDADDARALQILAVANELAAGDLAKKNTLPAAQRSNFQ